MGVKSRCAVTLMVALVFVPWAMAGAGLEETFDQSYPLAPDGNVALENVNGDVTVEVWERPEVRILAVKSASSQEILDGLEIEVDADPNALQIDTRYPSMRGTIHGRDSFVKVEYTLTIPRTARLDDIDLVNGSLKVVGVEGGISVGTVNGDIDVRGCAGDADISTVNGALEVHVDRLDLDNQLEMESVNGQLDLYLASSIGADLEAESVNGKLGNDFGIEVRKGKYVGSDFHGRVGDGGAKIALETVNGSIEVHRW